MPIRTLGRDAPSLGSLEQSLLKKVGLVYVFDRHRILAGRGGEGVEADGAALVLLDHRP